MRFCASRGLYNTNGCKWVDREETEYCVCDTDYCNEWWRHLDAAAAAAAAADDDDDDDDDNDLFHRRNILSSLITALRSWLDVCRHSVASYHKFHIQTS